MPGRITLKAKSYRTRRSPGEMNGLEREFATHLDMQKLAGEIADWRFDRIKLRLAKLCYLTVDFAVLMPDGELRFYETKGFMEDDALIKLKVVAEEWWWFRFYLVKKRAKRDGGGFSVVEL